MANRVRMGVKKCLATAAGFVGLACGVCGQTQPAHKETPDHPPAASAMHVGPAGRVPAPGAIDGPAHIQVNVNAQGLNIIGDAANEPSIAVDPTAPNRMAAGWRQFDTIASNFREAGNAWSHDGGRTWRRNPDIEDGVFRSDPVLDSDRDGNFFYLSLAGGTNFQCQVFKSTDHGRTWGPPVQAFGGDKMWFTISHPVGLGEGNIYGSWSTCCGTWSSTPFTRSVNRGLSYVNPIAMPGNPIWGTLAVGPDGELYVAGRAGSTGFRVVKSVNARDPMATPTFTFSDVNMGGTFPSFAGPNPGGLVAQVWVDVDRSSGPRRGHVYVLCGVDPPGADPMDVHIARSTNGGASWSAPVRVNDDPTNTNAWQWMPTMSVAPSGRIDAIWNDGRNGGGDPRMSELFYSFSTDGGQTWSANQRLSPSWDSHVGWPAQNKIGDYYHMRSDLVGADLIWSATFNGEQDVYYLRIGDRDCNQNGIGDAQDFASGVARDCNSNDIPDSCEIAAGAVPDANNNGIPDPCECYADCEPNKGGFVLDVFDFLCFQNRYAANDPYACDCDTSTGPGVCDIFDFLCFQNAYDAGCP